MGGTIILPSYTYKFPSFLSTIGLKRAYMSFPTWLTGGTSYGMSVWGSGWEEGNKFTGRVAEGRGWWNSVKAGEEGYS